MSTLRFNFTFNMTSGDPKKVTVDVPNVMSTTDNVTSNLLAAPVLGTDETASMSVSALAARAMGDLSCTVSAGNMLADMRAASRALYPALSDRGAIEFFAGGTVFVKSTAEPTPDIFTGAIGRYKFVATGPLGTSVQVTLAVVSGVQGSTTTQGGIQLTQTTYTLQPGDTLNAEGSLLDDGSFGYYVNVVRALYDSNSGAGVAEGTVKTYGSLLPVGTALTLEIPDIGIRVIATSTSTSATRVTLLSTTGATLSPVDIRRDTTYSGTSAESYTMDGGSLSATSPLNIDDVVYANSQDTDHVMIGIGGKVWQLRYWFCGGNARGLLSATKLA